MYFDYIYPQLLPLSPPTAYPLNFMCPFKKNSVTHQLQFVLSVFFWSMVEPIKSYTLKEN